MGIKHTGQGAASESSLASRLWPAEADPNTPPQIKVCDIHTISFSGCNNSCGKAK